jgi:radical SAM superfamily enzyme YgiQ (UPF0313 family)
VSNSYEQSLRDIHSKERSILPGTARSGYAIALTYPNRYHVAMSNLGFLSVYRLLAERFDVSAERATLPDPKDEHALRTSGRPIRTIESQRDLRSKDAILFSISFENDYINVLKILSLSGIPVRSSDRADGHPLVGAGGVAMMINPEALSPFVDFFALGEAEGLTDELSETLVGAKQGGLSREETLEELAEIPGIYVPTHFSVSYAPSGVVDRIENLRGRAHRVPVRRLDDFDTAPFCSPLVSDDTEFSDMLLVEMGRGCPYNCAFCGTKTVYGKVRHRRATDVIADMEGGADIARRVGLVGPAVAAHPEFLSILRHVQKGGTGLGLPSIRTESLDDDGIRLLAELGVKTITLAPETGSEGLRAKLGKGISDEEIIDLAVRAVDNGIIQFRLYFLIGVPGETQDDRDGIVDLVKRIHHQVRSGTGGKKRVGRITASINPLVPKPHTPLMWMAMAEPKELMTQIRALTGRLKKIGGVTTIYEPPKWSYIQCLLARGDRRVADILEVALENNENWNAAMKQTPINPDFYVLRERDEHETFPWDILDYDIDTPHLYSRYRKIIS